MHMKSNKTGYKNCQKSTILFLINSILFCFPLIFNLNQFYSFHIKFYICSLHTTSIKETKQKKKTSENFKTNHTTGKQVRNSSFNKYLWLLLYKKEK